MVFGRVESELIQLNDSSLWSGGPVKTNVNPTAHTYLPLIQKALIEKNDYSMASDFCKKMQRYYTEYYLPFGDIRIRQKFDEQLPTRYYRDLNLVDATSTTRYTVKGITFTRAVFVSAPDNVMIIHITSFKSHKGKVYQILAVNKASVAYNKTKVLNN